MAGYRPGDGADDEGSADPAVEGDGGDLVTFVTDAVRSAVEQASALAGDDGWIGVGGPNVIGQCLQAGLLDEVRINLVPVLLGDGIRYFGGLGPAALDDPTIIEGDRVTHLIYRVRR
jgi:dihydrofolate reductase